VEAPGVEPTWRQTKKPKYCADLHNADAGLDDFRTGRLGALGSVQMSLNPGRLGDRWATTFEVRARRQREFWQVEVTADALLHGVSDSPVILGTTACARQLGEKAGLRTKWLGALAGSWGSSTPQPRMDVLRFGSGATRTLQS